MLHCRPAAVGGGRVKVLVGKRGDDNQSTCGTSFLSLSPSFLLLYNAKQHTHTHTHTHTHARTHAHPKYTPLYALNTTQRQHNKQPPLLPSPSSHPAMADRDARKAKQRSELAARDAQRRLKKVGCHSRGRRSKREEMRERFVVVAPTLLNSLCLPPLPLSACTLLRRFGRRSTLPTSSDPRRTRSSCELMQSRSLR